MKLLIYFIIIVLTAGCFRTRRSAFDPSTPSGTLSALIQILSVPSSSSDSELEPVMTYNNFSGVYYIGLAFEDPASISNVKSCSVSPSLPAGITLDSANCKISGTPTSASSLEIYTVTAKNITKTKKALLLITVEKRYSIFVTNSSTQGSFTDSVCSSDGNKPSTGTFKAMIVSSTRRACSTANCSGGVSENLDWVFRPNTKYYRTDRVTQILETDSSGIFFTMQNPFSTGSSNVWTGLNANFTNSANTCSNWTNNMGAFSGAYGQTNMTSSAAYSGSTQVSSSFANVVCVEQ